MNAALNHVHVVPISRAEVAGIFSIPQTFPGDDPEAQDAFTAGYMEAARYEGDRLDSDQRTEAEQACAAFQSNFCGILEDCYAWRIAGVQYGPSLAGRDFYYCRTVGRAGGWSRLEDAGEILTREALEWRLPTS